MSTRSINSCLSTYILAGLQASPNTTISTPHTSNPWLASIPSHTTVPLFSTTFPTELTAPGCDTGPAVDLSSLRNSRSSSVKSLGAVSSRRGFFFGGGVGLRWGGDMLAAPGGCVGCLGMDSTGSLCFCLEWLDDGS